MPIPTLGRLLLLLLLQAAVAPVLAAPGSEAPAGQAEGAGLVERLHATLTEAMQMEGDAQYAARLAKIEPLVESSFDFDTIARAILGRRWRQLSDEHKANFLRLFKDLSAATYASRFDGFAGERFVTESVERRDESFLEVRTRLERPEDAPVRFVYLLRETGGQWRIVNVMADGVSDVALKRADYSSVIEQEGFEGLLDRLAAQLEALSPQAGP